MKIATLSLDGLRGLPDRTFSFADASTGAPRDLVVVTGPSGSGKTSLLEAIVAAKEDVGPYGFPPSTEGLVRPGAAAAKVSVGWWLNEEERRAAGAGGEVVSSESIFLAGGGLSPARADHDPGLQTILERYDHDDAHGKVEYFRADRTLSADLTGAGALRASEQRRLRLSPDTRKYAAIPRFLLDLVAEGPDGAARLGRFERLFADLCPGRSFAGARRVGEIRTLLFQGRRGSPDPSADEVPLARLSRSEQQAALFAATAAMIGLSRSIVLVDEPELHLGSDRAAAFVGALGRLGEDNQIIVATGSREIIASAPPAAVLHLGG